MSFAYRLEARDSDGELIGVCERLIVDGTIKEHSRIYRNWRTWVKKNLPHWCEIEMFPIDDKGVKCHHTYRN